MTAPVATPRMLYLVKRDTVRLQDKADAERLRVLRPGGTDVPVRKFRCDEETEAAVWRDRDEANARAESREAANRRRDVNPACDEP